MDTELQILKTTINIGIKKPFKLLHVTDTHIALDDVGNDCGRIKYFPNAIEYFFQALQYLKENNLTMLNTGDLLDFLSEENYAFVDKYLADIDYIYAVGNHDFCHFVGKAKEDYEYKWKNIKRTAPHFRCNLYFDSRIINGVNIVTLDDSYYLIGQGQIECLKAEAAKGYPIILAMHNPIYTEGYEKEMLSHGEKVLYVVNAPERILATYSEDRRLQQTPDDATKRAVEYIMNEPLIKAIVVGHTHRNYVEIMPNGVPQITTHGSYAGFVRELEIV